MARVSVVVPWRGGCPHREVAWRWVRPRLEATFPDWQIATGECPDGPWVKALAVADALERTDGDVVVMHDADVWCDRLGEAVRSVVDGTRVWATPHRTVHRLTAEATAAVLAGGELAGKLEQAPYRATLGGGIVVLGRATYDDCPLDPRITGWGQEDEAWALALRVLHGRQGRLGRGVGQLWHLWHPPQPRLTRRVGSDANVALTNRYRAARAPEAMRALLDETKEHSA